MIKNIHHLDITFGWDFANKPEWTSKLYIVYDRIPVTLETYGETYFDIAKSKLKHILKMSRLERYRFLKKTPKLDISWLMLSIAKNDPISYYDIDIYEITYTDIGEEKLNRVSLGRQNRNILLSKLKGNLIVINSSIKHIKRIRSPNKCTSSDTVSCWEYGSYKTKIYNPYLRYINNDKYCLESDNLPSYPNKILNIYKYKDERIHPDNLTSYPNNQIHYSTPKSVDNCVDQHKEYWDT